MTVAEVAAAPKMSEGSVYRALRDGRPLAPLGVERMRAHLLGGGSENPVRTRR